MVPVRLLKLLLMMEQLAPEMALKYCFGTLVLVFLANEGARTSAYFIAIETVFSYSLYLCVSIYHYNAIAILQLCLIG